MISTKDKIQALSAAYDVGRATAKAMLSIGNKFLGGMNVADACGYARDTAEWNFAMEGAMSEIDKVRVYCDEAGVITNVVPRD